MTNTRIRTTVLTVLTVLAALLAVPTFLVAGRRRRQRGPQPRAAPEPVRDGCS